MLLLLCMALAVGLSLCSPAMAEARGLRVAITKGPGQTSASSTARIRWRSNTPALRARCRLDGKRPSPCRSRLVYRHLGDGRHRFRVTVRRGHRLASAVAVWRVKQLFAQEGRRSRPVRQVPPPSTSPPPDTSQPVSSDVIWRGDMESGSLSDWYAPETSATGNYGGGEYNSGGGDTAAVPGMAHSGLYSAQANLLSGSGGTRLFRWREPRANRELVYSAWFYIPSAFRLTGDPSNGHFWDIFQFKSRSTSGAIDPMWYLDLQNRSDGSLYPTLLWWHKTLPGPHLGESGFRRYEPPANVSIPTGRWFQVTARMRQSKDFDGYVQFWIDGQLAFDQQGIRTSYENCSFNAWCTSDEWSVNNYSDGLTPSPSSLYIDDAQIGL